MPLHFCQRQAHRCPDTTVYRDPIHVDVFRTLPGRSYETLGWLKGVKRDEADKLIDFSKIAVPGRGGADSGDPGAGNPPPGPGEDVQTGAEGIDGLAAALGSHGGQAPGGNRPAAKPKAREEPRDEKEEKGASSKASGLQGVIAQRVAPEPADSALKIRKASSSKRKKKKDKKRAKKQAEKERKRARKSDDKDADASSDESSSTASSSSDSLFRLAALPQGTDRLHRLHQERPGMLANLTLRRFQELLQRSVGGGTAEKDQDMPAVARAYLSQIYLPRHPEGTIGLRNLRELRTLTTLVDMIAQNDLLRALDVAVQRIKSIELFVAQGQWSQANLIELILPEEEQRAWFRQELKAAQQEQKSDLRLQQDQWPRRRQAWAPSHAAAGGAEKKEGEAKDDTPPSNGGSPGKGKKGKGKGRKGRGKW